MAQQLKLEYIQNKAATFRSPSHRCSPFSHTSLPRPALCRAAPTKKGAEKSNVRESTNGSDLPVFESNKDDQGEFLPVRNPGTFPNIAVRGRVSSIFERIAADHFDGADEKYAVKSAGGVKEFDPLRDGPLRYLGYANECGEAFAAWLPLWGVPMSYAVAVGYVLVDTADKGLKAYALAQQELDANASLHPTVDTPRLEKVLAVERALDTVVWQLLASVICPGYTIHTVVALVHAGLLPLEQLEPVRQSIDALAASISLQGDLLMTLIDKSLPTAFGLGAIPFIVHPIDNTIHALLNATMRPALRKYVCGPGQGALADLDMCADCKLAAEQPSPSSNNGAQ